MEKQVYKAISAVTAEMGKEGISKARKNASQGYNFRGIDDVYNALNGALTRASLVIIPRIVSREVVERTSKSGSAMFYVTVAAEFDIVSAVDGSTHTARAYGEAQDNGDKATNKAMSAAYKYMAMQLFCIPTEGDNDADATTPEESIPMRKVVSPEMQALRDELAHKRAELRKMGGNPRGLTKGDVEGMTTKQLQEEIIATQTMIDETSLEK